MSTRYRCGQERRRVRAMAAGLNGIDYVEVKAAPGPPPGPTTLEIRLLSNVAVAGLTLANLRVEGGVRFPPPPLAAPLQIAGATLTVTCAPAGAPPAPQFALADFSTYRLRLVDAAGTGTPAGFDPELCAVEFSFKVECPTPYDCVSEAAPETPPPDAEPAVDYGARDWSTFRSLMLDRLAALLPTPPSESPVDFLTTQVEVLAAVADHLSYRIDAVATERTLFTARHRTSLARHARLLDYEVHEGCNARTFLQFTYEPPNPATLATLPAGTPVTTARAGVGARVTPATYIGWLGDPPIVFETATPLVLRSAHNEIAFHTWSDEHCRLPAGATRATLRSRLAPAAEPIALAPGDLLLLQGQSVDPVTEERRDDRRRRHVVRLTAVVPRVDPVEGNLAVVDVAWSTEDALPFDLVINVPSTRVPGAQVPAAIARANVVIADHGVTLPPRGATPAEAAALAPTLSPPAAPANGAWRPTVSRRDVARLAPVARAAPWPSAAALAAGGADDALPALSIHDDYDRWEIRRTLLASQRFGRDCVVETEHDGRASLRFGDGVLGLAPPPGATLSVAGRFGRPSDGRVGADVLRVVATATDHVTAVTNPLAAVGAVDPVEPAVIRLEAPQAFRTQRRAVTEADWARVARAYPGVQDAVARIRWTGAWRTAFVYIDRAGGLEVESDTRFVRGLAAHFERHRLAGGDVTIRGAVAVPLDITLRACVCPGRLRAEVLAGLYDRLGSGVRADGRLGFFHPDAFSFGTPLYLSALLAAAMEVDGVASVAAVDFRRWARSAAGELAAGVIVPGDLEVLRLTNDPSFPEDGRLGIDLVGGL